MSMTKIQELACGAALNKMLRSDMFSICIIDDIAKVMGVNVHNKAYATLRVLHCMRYNEIPIPVKMAIPDLIRECLYLDDNFRWDAEKDEPKTYWRQLIEKMK